MYVNFYYDNVKKEIFEPFTKKAYYEGNIIPKNKKGMHKWIIDNRVPLSESENLKKANEYFIKILKMTGIRQIAAQGAAAMPLIGGILSSSPFDINAGIIRKESKGYGKNKRIEGTAKPNEPILLIDDLINGGNSAMDSIEALRESGFSNISLCTLMWYSWGKGKDRLGILEGQLPYYYAIRVSKTK
tara:strand:- start:516 stop:1076 length:561 start_codon:yes stop_codon:yes gene_type:complete